MISLRAHDLRVHLLHGPKKNGKKVGADNKSKIAKLLNLGYKKRKI